MPPPARTHGPCRLRAPQGIWYSHVCDAATSCGSTSGWDGSMANEWEGVSKLSHEGLLLYAAHTAVAQSQRSAAVRVEREGNDGRRPSGATRTPDGSTRSRFLSLSTLQLERVAPSVAFQAKVVSTMLRPDVVLGSGPTAMMFTLVAMKHRDEAGTIDLAPIQSLPEGRAPATDFLLRAAAYLLPPDGDIASSPFDAHLRRLLAVGPQALPPEGDVVAAEYWLDLAERELEDFVSVDLSTAADRARISRRDIEKLTRANLIPRVEAKRRTQVHLGAVRRALGLPFLFPPLVTLRVDGVQVFDRGNVHFIRGSAPVAGGEPLEDGYLEFAPREPGLRDAIARSDDHR